MDKYELIEEELFRRGEGYCFGEWALIYKQPRSASIYTLEDCVFFTLGEIPFKNSFLRSLDNSEFNKKKFAMDNFLPFDIINERLLYIYKNIVPITCNKNQIIFNEGDKSDSIYLVYLGSFILEKKYGYKMFSVLNLEKGSIIGLESIYEGINSKYKCSLRLSNGFNFGLIFQLKINKLRPHLIKKMKIAFETNYNLFLNSWRELLKTNIYVREFLLNKLKDENIKENNKEILLDYVNDSQTCETLLKLQKENKYEALFKKFNKSKDYENRKKNGSLRIYSSKQKSRIYDKEEEKNIIHDNINIVKYFQQISKSHINYSRINLKSASPLKTRKLSRLNYNENSFNKGIKKDKYNNITKTEKNEELNELYSKTDNPTFNHHIKKNQKYSELIKKTTKNLKFHFRNNDSDIFKQNMRYNKSKSQSEIIDFFDNNKQNENSKIIFRNKKNKLKERIKNFISNTKEFGIKSNKIKEGHFSNIRKNLIHKSYLKKSDSQRKLNDINLISKINKENISNQVSIINTIKSSTNSTRNIIKNIPNRSLFSPKTNKNRKRLFSHDNIYKTIKLKKSTSLRQVNYLSPKTDKIIQYIEKVSNQSSNNSIHEQNQQAEDKLILNNKIKTFSEKYTNIYKEFNLNNGFSISYFKKINQNNKLNDFEIIQYKSKDSLSPNKFKITFDSGDFNIPLVSSTIRYKGSYKK